MINPLYLLYIVLFFNLFSNNILGQSKGNVIVPTVEYIDDNTTNKPPTNNSSQTGVILLENNYEDLFEDYEGKAIIDKKPEYRAWGTTYILEKVVYTKTEIIFSIAIYFPASAYTNAIFYPRNHHYHWFLKDLSTGKKYSYKSVSLIKKNGVLELEKLTDFPLKVAVEQSKQTVFTCRIHFDRLPKTTRLVDLIEGRGKAKDINHFNFFDIKIKQPYLD